MYACHKKVERLFNKMDKFLNMLENHIGFCTKVHKKKENLAAESFPQIPFGEWFSGKKENIAKNYSMLPPNSLVSKDGVEADLKRLHIIIKESHTSTLI